MAYFFKPFTIKRLQQDEAERLRNLWVHSKSKTIQRNYNITKDEQRYQFLYAVINQNLTVNEAGLRFGIKYTTAKNILDLFIKEGRIQKKKHRLRLDGITKDMICKKICQN